MRKLVWRPAFAFLVGLMLALGASVIAQQLNPTVVLPNLPSLPSSQLLVTATAAANAAATATLAPAAGQWTYITAFEITVCGDATGDAAAATPATFTWAGFTTNSIHKIDSTHTAGVCYSRFYTLSYPMKSASTGSAVAQTLTSSSATHMIPNINIWGFYSSTSY